MQQPTFEIRGQKHNLDSDTVSLSPALTLRETMRILLRRRWLVIASIAALVAVVAGLIASITPHYKATATVLIDPRRTKATETTDQPPATSMFNTYDPLIESQVLVIKSSAVLERVVDELKLFDDPEFKPHSHWFDPLIALLNVGQNPPKTDRPQQELAKLQSLAILAHRLKVSREGTSFVINIVATSESPDKAAKIANAVAHAYLDEEVHSYNNTSKTAASWFNQQLDELRIHEQELQNKLSQLQASSDTYNSSVQLRELVRELGANRSVYDTLLTRYKQTAAQGHLQLPDTRIVAQADVPIKPSFPRPLLMFGAAVLLGFPLGVGLAFVVDSLDPRVKTLRQAKELTNVPTLAAIPLVGAREIARHAKRGRKALRDYDPKATGILPPAVQPPLMRYIIEEPTSLFAEGVRAVRLAVLRGASNKSIKMVMVSSSIDGEGKTTLAVNLALSLATIGRRTILVDGDLRNPETTRSLCPQARVGLIEVATRRASINEAMLVDKPTGLFVLPTPPRNAALINEFVFSSSMIDLLENLRRYFEFVIIDSPPLVPLVDARALAERADGVVLAIRWDATPQDVIAHSIETLNPAMDRVIGTVLTRVDMRRLRFYDYYRSSSFMEPYSYLGQPRVEPTT
jgi:capsular exopolysaccharide synthesis family protein